VPSRPRPPSESGGWQRGIQFRADYRAPVLADAGGAGTVRRVRLPLVWGLSDPPRARLRRKPLIAHRAATGAALGPACRLPRHPTPASRLRWPDLVCRRTARRIACDGPSRPNAGASQQPVVGPPQGQPARAHSAGHGQGDQAGAGQRPARPRQLGLAPEQGGGGRADCAWGGGPRLPSARPATIARSWGHGPGLSGARGRRAR
jgi:hypothetical protein